MILDKVIQMTLTNRNITFYKNKGYAGIQGDIINIKPEDLTHGSDYKVNVKCDHCEYTNYIKFHSYTIVTNKLTEDYYCPICSVVKIKRTKFIRHGNENYVNHEKAALTNIKKYGVPWTQQNKEIRKKSAETNLIRYGNESPNGNDEVKKRRKESCLNNLGVENCMQSSIVMKKQQVSARTIKNFKNLTYQGTYELDFLINFFDKFIIENAKSVKYSYDGKTKVYHPDFYLPKYNLIVEIKSDYIYNREVDVNLAKQEACLNQGYNFIFIINKNYGEFLKNYF
jgi:hypothetical protein